ncbi:MAG: M20/M25/M40 family metallo-hydrolase [Promethearchaeota archaeon]
MMFDHNFSEVVTFRKKFHAYPELAWREFWTTSQICNYLEQWGYKDLFIGKDLLKKDQRKYNPPEHLIEEAYKKALEKGAPRKYMEKMIGGFTGVVAIMDSKKPGPTIGFRGDIDALPIQEAQTEDHRPFKEGFSSKNDGVSHACGHDCHTSISLTMAHYVANNIEKLHGKFVFVFSAAEESAGGSCLAIKDLPIIDEIDYFYCYHVIPLPLRGKSFLIPNVMFQTLIEYLVKFEIIGEFETKPDNLHVNEDDVVEWVNAQIRLENSRPDIRTIDVFAAAHAINLIQAIPQPRDFAGKVCIEKFHTQLEGEIDWNVYRKKHECQFAYQIRTKSDQRAIWLQEQIVKIIKHVEDIYHVKATITGPTATNYPALTENHPNIQNAFKEAWNELGHEGNFINEQLLNIGTDDVIFILNKVDQNGGGAAYVGLAFDNQGGKINSLHIPNLDVHDQNLIDGTKAAILVLHKLLDKKQMKKRKLRDT